MVRYSLYGLSALAASMALYFGIFPKMESEAKRIFTYDEIVWFGMDFTKAHFVGTFNQGFGSEPATGNELRNNWIPAWNALVLAEPQNFNLKRSFRKRNVYYDIMSVNLLNDKLNKDDLLSYNETRIGKDEILEMVKLYSSNEKKEGVGLVFIVENFNKTTVKAGLHVTFFDIATKKVLLSEFLSGNAVGFGLRNYWAGAIKNVLDWIDFYEYNKWKRRVYDQRYEDAQDELSKAQNSAR